MAYNSHPYLYKLYLLPTSYTPPPPPAPPPSPPPHPLQPLTLLLPLPLPAPVSWSVFIWHPLIYFKWRFKSKLLTRKDQRFLYRIIQQKCPSGSAKRPLCKSYKYPVCHSWLRMKHSVRLNSHPKSHSGICIFKHAWKHLLAKCCSWSGGSLPRASNWPTAPWC